LPGSFTSALRASLEGSDIVALIARGPHFRWSLIVAYLLATALVHGAHDHGPRRAGRSPIADQGDSADRDPRLKIAVTPDSPHLAGDCASCQFLSQHQAACLPAGLPDRPPSVDVDDPGGASILEGFSLRPACRDPPLV
jgi:hypothetical protein